MTVTPDFALFSEIGEEAAGICDEHWEQPSTCEGWRVKHRSRTRPAGGRTRSDARMLGYLLRYRKEALAGHHMALDMGDTLPRARGDTGGDQTPGSRGSPCTPPTWAGGSAAGPLSQVPRRR